MCDPISTVLYPNHLAALAVSEWEKTEWEEYLSRLDQKKRTRVDPGTTMDQMDSGALIDPCNIVRHELEFR